jgi:hypothetical protein
MEKAERSLSLVPFQTNYRVETGREKECSHWYL